MQVSLEIRQIVLIELLEFINGEMDKDFIVNHNPSHKIQLGEYINTLHILRTRGYLNSFNIVQKGIGDGLSAARILINANKKILEFSEVGGFLGE